MDVFSHTCVNARGWQGGLYSAVTIRVRHTVQRADQPVLWCWQVGQNFVCIRPT